MISKNFILSSEYIELYKLLKLLRLAQSGAHAKLLIEDGEVTLNNKIETRKRAKLRSGDVVRLGDNEVKIKQSEG
jgi:ribosome-associated protein